MCEIQFYYYKCGLCFFQHLFAVQHWEIIINTISITEFHFYKCQLAVFQHLLL